MNLIKKAFGWIIKICGTIFLLILLFVGAVSFFSRQERALAKEFIEILSQQNYEAAYTRLHSDTQKDISPAALEQRFRNLQVYTSSSFTRVHIGSDATTLNGQATTDSNCTSAVTVVLRDEKIVSFFFEPACLRPDQSA
ncbi:hypothetical protein PXK00_07325 [Phaeobacter sp. QD34_3]|uniref:hypothetical protein n=1 Tax=unclassified Phaeobacter TaxID=2621772 RepID=UPI00237F86AE|nr:MULTISPECIES: hypothetical protein [unclassified Phaeobacter]MDE4132915.1 hypothetical protein [Phaeobacter sp. QD34_3]MDE4136683.1 hypothetical protein [Phaeobacter sp. QD34_24]